MIFWLFAGAVRGWHAFGGYRLSRLGDRRLPRDGAVLLAVNHTSYVDFTFAGVSVLTHDDRRVRFMGKTEMRRNPVLRVLMWGCGVIPVDRSAGHAAYEQALDRLRDGEVVAIYPESTISPSYEITDLKSGAARLALEAGVPLVPCIVWGSQRIAPKGRPNDLRRTRYPIIVSLGEPLEPSGDVEALTADLRTAMTDLLHTVQDAYPEHPAGAPWVPARLGGSAPSPEDA